MKYILLPKNKQVLVDDEDYDELSQHKWHLGNGYAMRHVTTKPDIREYMHRRINQTPDGMVTDHINGDKLDNRRCNLRSASLSQNGINYGRKVGANNPYRGVSRFLKRNLWRARITINKKEITIGYFKSPEEAKAVYDSVAQQLFGEFVKSTPGDNSPHIV